MLNESIDDSEKAQKVTLATYPNKITLATYPFIRGTDFICRDKSVQVHIILTFMPELKTEFI